MKSGSSSKSSPNFASWVGPLSRTWFSSSANAAAPWSAEKSLGSSSHAGASAVLLESAPTRRSKSADVVGNMWLGTCEGQTLPSNCRVTPACKAGFTMSESAPFPSSPAASSMLFNTFPIVLCFGFSSGGALSLFLLLRTTFALLVSLLLALGKSKLQSSKEEVQHKTRLTLTSSLSSVGGPKAASKSVFPLGRVPLASNSNWLITFPEDLASLQTLSLSLLVWYARSRRAWELSANTGIRMVQR
mmetsp:Transcript_62007/g.130933  ORF Transcript_62007/g.130933 Transcript_62007/m.130933 type:complete len:245 (-) Transcript_62007:1108-1842(-)